MPAWCVPVSVSIHENGEEKKKKNRERGREQLQASLWCSRGSNRRIFEKWLKARDYSKTRGYATLSAEFPKLEIYLQPKVNHDVCAIKAESARDYKYVYVFSYQN